MACKSHEGYFKDVRAAAGWLGARIAAQGMPSLVGKVIALCNYRNERLALTTTGTYLEERFRDHRLRAVLASQWGDYGLPPSESAFAIHALVVGSNLGGGYYPIGGAATIASNVVDVVTKNGGQCLTNQQVTEIIRSDGRAVGVKTRSTQHLQTVDEEFFAPVVVSDAGAFTLFCHLLPADVAIPFRDDLERRAAGHGFLTLYLGFKDSPTTLGFRGENHWIYSGYDHDVLFHSRNSVLEGQPAACYLSLQSLKDPAATAHTGEIIAFLDYETVEAWKHAPWRNRGAEYAR